MIINFSDEAVNKTKGLKSIFLAGPTLRNSSFNLSWRKEACAILESLGFNGIVYVPEFSNGDNPMDFIEQAEWEREGLVRSDVIVFYVPRKFPELPGLTTNIEYGMYLARKPLSSLLCSPPGAEKNRYLEWLYTKEKPGAHIFRDLKEVLQEAVIIAG